MKRKFLALLTAVVVLVSLQGGLAHAQMGSGVYSSGNAFHSPVPSDAAYTYDGRLGTFRQGMQEWGAPVYRVQAGVDVPLVTITNTYSGRVETWPIPTYAVPASAEDGHLAVIHYGTGMVYELFAAVWTSSSTISAGGMVVEPINGDGVTDRPNRRVTASGVANTNGMVILEDFMVSGQINASGRINHALSLHIPRWMIAPDAYVAPAVGGEVAGTDTSGNGVPMGARFALPRNLDVDSLNVHPFTRELLRAARDFGLFVTDGTGTPTTSSGQAIGTIEVEPGLIQQVYGVDGNDLISVIEDEIASVIASYGIFRVTVGGGAQPPAQVPTTVPVVLTTAPIVPTLVPTTAPVVPTTAPVIPPDVPAEQPPVEAPPAEAPALSTGGSYGATAATVVAVGATVTVDIVLVNPVSVYGFVADCTITPEEILNGEHVTSAALFSGDARVRNDGFEWADYFYYTVEQRSPVNTTGSVVTLTLDADSAGTITMTCENYAISEGGEWVYVPFAPLNITVQ